MSEYRIDSVIDCVVVALSDPDLVMFQANDSRDDSPVWVTMTPDVARMIGAQLVERANDFSKEEEK